VEDSRFGLSSFPRNHLPWNWPADTGCPSA